MKPNATCATLGDDLDRFFSSIQPLHFGHAGTEDCCNYSEHLRHPKPHRTTALDETCQGACRHHNAEKGKPRQNPDQQPVQDDVRLYLSGQPHRHKEGDRKAAAESIPDEVVDSLLVWGAPEACKEHIARYMENGVTTPAPALFCGPDQLRPVLRALAR